VVGGVTENYLGHFAYLLPQGYEEAFGEEATFNVAYAKLADEVNKASFSARLLALAGVDTVSFVSDKMTTYEGMLDVMNKLIFLIMALSAALAFVVLYNLTNINITERIREIATLKVLGFTRSEANAYIFREIMVMSLIGALFGCVLGVPLTLYIAEAAETANMMFARAIEPMSFVFSFVLTILFTVLVMFTMRGKLARVNMVESLKSIE
jgi:putative ABC transport system permease protein